MFSKTVLLFLFGATVASSQFIPKLSMLATGCPPALELAPMICKLTQNIGLQVKPQLIAPSTFIPPLVVEKCDTPQLEINLPLPVEDKPRVIPAPPVLPPITLPKFPVPVLIEKPISPPLPILEPCEPVLIPEIPAMNIPIVPALPPKDFEPMAIPQAPELPMFEMPELPIRVPEPAMIVEPCPEDQPMQVVPVPEYVKPLVPIPAAPELPPARLPELPVRVEIPPQPILPPMIVEQTAEEPCLTGEVVIPQPLASLPVAPEFPVPVEIPTKPILPTVIFDQPIEEPCITGEVMVARSEPVLLPQPPRVPQFIMPEPQMEIMKPMTVPIFTAYPQAAVIADPCEPSGRPIVKMAELPPYFVKHSPSRVSIDNRKLKEYVIPTMAFNGFRPMEKYYVHRV